MTFIQISTLSVPGPFLEIFTTLKKLDVIQPKKPKTIQQHTKLKDEFYTNFSAKKVLT